jgi:hypothetical protein
MLLTFEAWMDLVDEICQTKYGVSVYDLADCPYRDWYEDDVTPKSAAARARLAQD